MYAMEIDLSAGHGCGGRDAIEVRSVGFIGHKEGSESRHNLGLA
jgi:hypothetical protein